MQTWFEYIRSLPPSKLAIFLRKKLASNQGCPPAPLMWVFTMCDKTGSCDECWWAWLEMERNDDKEPIEQDVKVYRCWDCRWGARGSKGGHPVVVCMHKDMNSAIMDPDGYCSNNDERYWEHMDNVSVPAEYLTPANAEAVGKELKRSYEIKQIKREIERRKQEDKDETVSERKDDQKPEPDPGEGQDRTGGD